MFSAVQHLGSHANTAEAQGSFRCGRRCAPLCDGCAAPSRISASPAPAAAASAASAAVSPSASAAPPLLNPSSPSMTPRVTLVLRAPRSGLITAACALVMRQTTLTLSCHVDFHMLLLVFDDFSFADFSIIISVLTPEHRCAVTSDVTIRCCSLRTQAVSAP